VITKDVRLLECLNTEKKALVVNALQKKPPVIVGDSRGGQAADISAFLTNLACWSILAGAIVFLICACGGVAPFSRAACAASLPGISDERECPCPFEL
jgi:hypothetical protein